ncbi:hypothetical protein Nmel_003902 [Mimus melanotis]
MHAGVQDTNSARWKPFLNKSAQLLTQTIAEIPPAHLQPLLPAACSGRRLPPGGLRRGETTSRFLRERRRKEREGPGRVWAHCSALLCQEVGDYELIPRPSQKVCRLPPLLPSPPARWRGRRQLAARRWPRSPRSCLIFRPLRRCCAWLRWDRNSRLSQCFDWRQIQFSPIGASGNNYLSLRCLCRLGGKKEERNAIPDCWARSLSLAHTHTHTHTHTHRRHTHPDRQTRTPPVPSAPCHRRREEMGRQ